MLYLTKSLTTQINLFVNKPVHISRYTSGQLSLRHVIKQHLSCSVCVSRALDQSHSLRRSLMFWISCYKAAASCSLQVQRRSATVLTSHSLLSALLRSSFYTIWAPTWPYCSALCGRQTLNILSGNNRLSDLDHTVFVDDINQVYLGNIQKETVDICNYLCPTPVDDVVRGLIDLALHLNRLLLVLRHFNTQDPEIGSSKVQGDEVPLFCRRENTQQTLEILKC